LSRQQYLERDKDQVWLPAQMPAIPLAAGEKKAPEDGGKEMA